MIRSVTRNVLALLIAVAALTSFGMPAQAHEGYPIILEAKYQEVKKGGQIRRMLFVNGHAHYPNGTRLSVGLRLEGQTNYVSWFKSAVKNQAFIVEMGPFNKEFVTGNYIVEAWFIWEEQPGNVQSSIVKSEEGLERGVDNCDPEIVKERKRCKTKSVFGACVVQVGTPGRLMFEEEETKSFLQTAYDSLLAVYTEITETKTAHSKAKKSEEFTAETWRAKSEEWIVKLNDLDDQISKWKNSKLTIRHQKAYAAAVNVIMNVQSLIGVYGQDLYNLTNDFTASGNAEGLAGEVVNNLNALQEDIKAVAEEPQEKPEEAPTDAPAEKK